MMVPQCFDCKQFFRPKPGKVTGFDAFPEGIPEVIRKNRHDHRQLYPGDHEIRFEPSESAIRLGLRSANPPYEQLTLPVDEVHAALDALEHERQKTMKPRGRVA
jgi:hypothetical protein